MIDFLALRAAAALQSDRPITFSINMKQEYYFLLKRGQREFIQHRDMKF